MQFLQFRFTIILVIVIFQINSSYQAIGTRMTPEKQKIFEDELKRIKEGKEIWIEEEGGIFKES